MDLDNDLIRINDNVTPAIGQNPVTIRIGSALADVRFASLSAAGLYQFNVVVPNLADGDYDVLATIARVRSQPFARLRIQR